MLLFMKL
jgi:hypothetical protein